MATLYSCLEEGGVGIFESPTGTGKSLSLLCATLRWLQDQDAKDERDQQPAPHADSASASSAVAAVASEPAWVEEQTAERKAVAQRAGRLSIAEARKQRSLRLSSVASAAAAVAAANAAAERAAEQAGVPAAGKGSAARKAAAARGGDNGAAKEQLSVLAATVAGAEDAVAGDEFALMEVDEEGVSMAQELALAALDDDDDDDAPARPPKRQVFFCSRTHSQLAQVVGEVQKTSYASSIAVASIGSRSNLCLHEPVRSRPADRINEACLDLQQAASKAKAKAKAEADVEAEAAAGGGSRGKRAAAAKPPKVSGCPYLASSAKHRGGGSGSGSGSGVGEEGRYGAAARMRDQLLQSPHDIEQLRELGREHGCCAYYAARAAVDEAELVLLPYASLLHAPTRATLGISLARSVVVVDEAHNLIDTVNEMHSAVATARQLSEASAQLAQYAERYHVRLKPTNRLFVQQLLYVVRALRATLTLTPAADAATPAVATAATATATAAPAATTATADETMLPLNSFLCSLNIDNINLFRLRAFCHASELAKKLRGFVESEGVRASAQAAYARAQRGGRAPDPGGGGGGGGGGVPGGAANSMHAVLALLEALTSSDTDARVLRSRVGGGGAGGGSGGGGGGGGAAAATPAAATPAAAAERPAEAFLRVLHLNPAVSFARVLDEAHAVVLAGGTMQPIGDL